MTREQRSAQAAGIGGLCFIACIAIVPLAYLSTLFRVYAPPLREWLIAHTEAAHLIILGWVA